MNDAPPLPLKRKACFLMSLHTVIGTAKNDDDKRSLTFSYIFLPFTSYCRVQIVHFLMINGECWFQISSKKAVEVINKQSLEPIWLQSYKEMQFQIVVSKVRIFLDRIGMMVLPEIHKKNKLVSQNIRLNPQRTGSLRNRIVNLYDHKSSWFDCTSSAFYNK